MPPLNRAAQTWGEQGGVGVLSQALMMATPGPCTVDQQSQSALLLGWALNPLY